MPPKANPTDDLPPSAGKAASGKLLIVGILTVAIAAAAASWWFRYSATHRAAQFWGPETARLIRDASVVEIWRPSNPIISTSAAPLVESSDLHDVSSARGLVHLRN